MGMFDVGGKFVEPLETASLTKVPPSMGYIHGEVSPLAGGVKQAQFPIQCGGVITVIEQGAEMPQAGRHKCSRSVVVLEMVPGVGAR